MYCGTWVRLFRDSFDRAGQFISNDISNVSGDEMKSISDKCVKTKANKQGFCLKDRSAEQGLSFKQATQGFNNSFNLNPIRETISKP